MTNEEFVEKDDGFLRDIDEDINDTVGVNVPSKDEFRNNVKTDDTQVRARSRFFPFANFDVKFIAIFIFTFSIAVVFNNVIWGDIARIISVDPRTIDFEGYWDYAMRFEQTFLGNMSLETLVSDLSSWSHGFTPGPSFVIAVFAFIIHSHDVVLVETILTYFWLFGSCYVVYLFTKALKASKYAVILYLSFANIWEQIGESSHGLTDFVMLVCMYSLVMYFKGGMTRKRLFACAMSNSVLLFMREINWFFFLLIPIAFILYNFFDKSIISTARARTLIKCTFFMIVVPGLIYMVYFIAVNPIPGIMKNLGTINRNGDSRTFSEFLVNGILAITVIPVFLLFSIKKMNTTSILLVSSILILILTRIIMPGTFSMFYWTSVIPAASIIFSQCLTKRSWLFIYIFNIVFFSVILFNQSLFDTIFFMCFSTGRY